MQSVYTKQNKIGGEYKYFIYNLCIKYFLCILSDGEKSAFFPSNKNERVHLGERKCHITVAISIGVCREKSRDISINIITCDITITMFYFKVGQHNFSCYAHIPDGSVMMM